MTDPFKSLHLAGGVLTVLACLSALAPSQTSAQDGAGACDIGAAIKSVSASPESNTAIAEFERLVIDDCLGQEPDRCDAAGMSELVSEACRTLDAWAERWLKLSGNERTAPDNQPSLIFEEIRTAARRLATEPRVPFFGRDLPSAERALLNQLNDWVDTEWDVWRAYEEQRIEASESSFEARDEMAERFLAKVPATWQRTGFFILFRNEPEEVDAETLLLGACMGSTAANASSQERCLRTFRGLVDVFTLFHLQRRLLLILWSEARTETFDYVTQLNQRWEAYFASGRALLPWELLLNGYVFKSGVVRRGFVEPPTTQLLFLHPAPAVEYSFSQDDELDSALVLELLGVYAWRWGGESGTEVRAPIRLPGFLDSAPLGGSLMLSFDGRDDPGYGAVVHLPRNWSLGVTVDGESEVSVLLSVDLGKLIVDEDSQRLSLLETFFRAAAGQ